MTHPILSHTYYQTLAIFTRHVSTIADCTTLDHEYFGPSFDDAATEYGKAMKDGSPAMVYELDLIHGTMIDMTEEAKLRLQHWCNLRKQDFPAWMTEPASDDGDTPEQRGYDAAKDAADERRVA